MNDYQRHTTKAPLDEIVGDTEDFSYFMREIGWREGLGEEVLAARHTVVDDGIFGKT
jgi:hypothetical protein